MDKKVINESQFRKLVISEAKKIIVSENEEKETSNNKRRIAFSNVESLISEMESMNTSIIKTLMEEEYVKEIVSESEDTDVPMKSEDPVGMWTPKKERDLNPIEHNKKKNIMHVNEGERDKWNRMLNYRIPSDDER